MYVHANGIRIHYEVDGRDDAPVVTFITGIANDLRMWDSQVPSLRTDFRVLRYDSRGHGGTEATPGDYSFGMLIADLLGLWDGLGIRQSHLVGLGLGGATAIGVAIDHSDRLLTLVPCCCRAEMTPAFAVAWRGFVETVTAHGMEGMVEQTVQRWFTDDFKTAHPEMLESVRSQIRGTSPLGYYGCIAAFLTLNFGDRIRQVSVPALFVSGADDLVGGPPQLMQSLADAVPGARHASIPRAAHICNIQNPEAFNEVVGKFLRGEY
jgi:3-oxoadipate enol-lactonase